MTITRVGTTKKYSEGWEAAFGPGRKKRKSTTAKNRTGAKAAAKKKSAKSTKAKAVKKTKKTKRRS